LTREHDDRKNEKYDKCVEDPKEERIERDSRARRAKRKAKSERLEAGVGIGGLVKLVA
jgi:hypothetical protein